MKEIYSWVPWFAELCGRIAENGPEYLVERVGRIPWKEGGGEAALLRYGDGNVDPFSFVYTLAAHHRARRRVYSRVGEEFGLASELPLELDEAFVFPTPLLINTLFHSGGDGDPALLGRLFRSAVEGIEAVSGEEFEQAQRISGVAAAKLTQALFLVNGREFLPYDGTTQHLRGDDAERHHTVLWSDYRNAVAGLRDAFPGCRPYEINLLAYETGRTEDPLRLNPENVWQISTKVRGDDDPRDLWGDFERDNCAYTGGPGKGGWDEYDPASGASVYRVAEPRRGDILLVRYGRAGRGVGVVYRNDYAEALTNDARIHVLWLAKGETQLPGNWRVSAFSAADAVGDAFREAYPRAFAFLHRSARRDDEDVDTAEEAARIRAVPTIAGPLNTILYGPPGTGKTYRTIARSVEICDGSAPGDGKLRARYDELVAEGRIAFATFHQSYGYEEFVEGIRPDIEGRAVVYRVAPGLLKRFAEAARRARDAVTAREGAEVSFDVLWGELLERARTNPVVRTRSSEREHVLGTGGDSISLEPVDGGESRSYSRERVGRLWASGLRKDPAETTPTEVTALDTGTTHGSYMWIVYKELWDLAQLRDTGAVPNFVLVIDEINRANVSKVMGELITLLEEDKRQWAENEVSVTLPYSMERFTLPANVHILGTMNTADRSIALLDTALRRRFDFEEMAPEAGLLEASRERTGVDLPEVLTAINERLLYLVDADHLVGHAWLMRARDRAGVDAIMRRKIIPLLVEYFYDDWDKVRAVLGGTDHFVARTVLRAPPGLEPEVSDDRYRWSVRGQFAEDAYHALLRGGEDGG